MILGFGLALVKIVLEMKTTHLVAYACEFSCKMAFISSDALFLSESSHLPESLFSMRRSLVSWETSRWDSLMVGPLFLPGMAAMLSLLWVSWV